MGDHPARSPAVRRAASLLAGYRGRWAIAGGWAVDLYLGRQTRPHADVDVAVVRSDQLELQRFLAGVDVRKAQGGALIPWQPAELLALPTHELHARWPSGDHLEFLLNEADDQTNVWTFRRESSVRRPLELVIRATDGTSYLSPEVVLLYKAKRPQPRDDADLESVLSLLVPEARQWLAAAIAATHGTHPWSERLSHWS